MAARKRAAAQGDDGKFISPMLIEDERGTMPIYELDPRVPEPPAGLIPGWRGWLGTQICRMLGVGPEDDEGHGVWKVTTAGVSGPDGNLWVADATEGHGVPDGNLWVADATEEESWLEVGAGLVLLVLICLVIVFIAGMF